MLEAAGASPVPSASPAFVASLEQRLLGTTTTATLSSPSERRGFSRAQRTRALLMPAAAAIAAVIVTGALAGLFTGSTGSSDVGNVKLSAAKDTVVELPNGNEVRGEAGLGLPDGSVVKTGPNGSASFGNVDLGPGSVATVDNGKIVITPPPTTVPTLPITVPTLPITVPAVTIPTIPGVQLPGG
jgi:hypothetical protein